ILKVNCNNVLFISFLLLYFMRVRAAHKGSNQAPVVLGDAHTEKKYIVPTPEMLQSNLKLPIK
ncbi:hypothetical protein N301_15468, partial [Charadrius vociferus]